MACRHPRRRPPADPGEDAISPTRKAYVAATVGWVAGFTVPLVVSAVGIGYFAAHAGGEDWGLEWLLLVPVVVLGLVAFGPICCFVALRLARSPLAGPVAVWSFLTGPACLVCGFLAMAVVRVGGVLLLAAAPALAVAIAQARATRSEPVQPTG